MGFIADAIAKARSPVDQERWDQAFGTFKERGSEEKTPVRKDSILVSDWAVVRLLQAMRSMAPGGWTDDRYEQSKHFVGIQYVAIHRTGEQLAQSEFQVFKKDVDHPKGKRPVPSTHPLVQLLSHPNPEDSFGDLMYSWAQQLGLTGTALTWMVPNRLGKPMELYPIPTATAVPQATINDLYPSGYYRIQPLYPYGPFSSQPSPMTSVGAAIDARWMLRVKYQHPLLRYEGYSPQTALRLHIDEVESMDRSRWYSMKRSINPSAVLNLQDMEGSQPLPTPEIERIRAEFEAAQQGPENSGQLFVSAPGGRLEPWGGRPVDMDYQAGWDQLVSFILAGMGITKPAAGVVDTANYATLFAALKQYHLLTLKPLIRRVESQLTRRLAPFFGEDLIIEIRTPRIDDHEVKQGVLNQLIQGKAITKNELRQELDMSLTKEDWGDEIAGTEPQPEQDPNAMAAPGMEGAPIAGVQDSTGQPIGAMDEDPTSGLLDDDAGLENNDVSAGISTPIPGKLGLGGLGPRKGLTVEQKGLYNRIRKILRNGHHSTNGVH